LTQLINVSEQSDINHHLRSIRVVRGKIEASETQSQITEILGGHEEEHKVDTIVSEPIGVLLFHERMVSPVLSFAKDFSDAPALIHDTCALQVESFLAARDLYLKPNGSLYPSSGKLWFVPFEDKAVWTETDTKVCDSSLPNESIPGADSLQLV